MEKETQSAFLELYEPLHERFVRYCSSRAFGLLETDDLVQEAILIALRNFEKIKDREKLLGYLIGTVNNLLRQARRRQKFQGEWEDSTLEKIRARTTDPEVALDVHFLLKAIDKLNEKQKEALLLFEVSGYSVLEIGTIQGDSVGAVKTRLSRGRKKLRKMLENSGRPEMMVSGICSAFVTGGVFDFPYTPDYQSLIFNIQNAPQYPAHFFHPAGNAAGSEAVSNTGMVAGNTTSSSHTFVTKGFPTVSFF